MNIGAYIEPSKLTVASYLEKWLSEWRTKVSAKTWQEYEGKIRLHIVPQMGNVPLEKLQPLQIEELYSRLLGSGRKGRGEEAGLTAQTVLHVHRIFARALGQAVKWRLIVRNPVDAVEPPGVDRPEMNSYDVDGAKRLLEEAKRSTIYIPVLLAFHTGMRRGEICGLQWADVDLDRGLLAVRRSVEQTKKGILGQEKVTLRFKEPKTGKSRVIAMPKALVEALRRLKGEQAQRRLLLAEAWQDNGLVCPNDDGTLRTPDGLSRAFARLIKKAGLPHLRLHDCRHTHATLLLADGEHVKVVAERLGHSTTRLTMDTYAHVLKGMQQGAADRLDAMFGEAGPVGLDLDTGERLGVK